MHDTPCMSHAHSQAVSPALLAGPDKHASDGGMRAYTTAQQGAPSRHLPVPHPSRGKDSDSETGMTNAWRDTAMCSCAAATTRPWHSLMPRDRWVLPCVLCSAGEDTAAVDCPASFTALTPSHVLQPPAHSTDSTPCTGLLGAMFHLGHVMSCAYRC